MVKKIEHGGKHYYLCEACDMCYRDENVAEKCEKYCNEKHACNMELIKHSVKLE